MRPSDLTEKEFPFPVKINHAITGHIYVRPISNIKPFSNSEEDEIVKILSKLEIKTIRNRVKPNFTVEETKAGYGFRIFQ